MLILFFFQLFPIESLQAPQKQYISNFKLSFLHTNWKGWHDTCQSRIKIVELTPQDSKTSGNITCMLWPSSRLRQLLSQVWHVFVKIAVNYRSWATKSRMYKNVRFPFIIPANERYPNKYFSMWYSRSGFVCLNTEQLLIAWLLYH